jgi:triacylglycerol lipase
MNAPISNYYDLENARVLVGLAEETYGNGQPRKLSGIDNGQAVEDAGSDTKAVVCRVTKRDVVVAFRGTRSLRNFVTDISARRVALKDGPVTAGVHEGFQWALDSVFDGILAVVQEAVGEMDSARVWITGHSLGAALAKLCAWRLANLKSEISKALAGVYTFGEPRLGNAVFRDCYDALLKSCSFRVVDGEDFITRIPWLLGCFRHCGHEVFYSSFSLQPLAFSIDPPWWVKGVSDVFGTWQEWRRDGRLALLEDHHVGRYVSLLSAPNLNLNPNPVVSLQAK